MNTRVFMERMPAGIPGDVTRPSTATIEPQHYDPSQPFPAYGVPGKIDGEKFVPLGTGDTAQDIYGLLVRPYPTGQSLDGTNQPNSNGICNVLKRGYMTVLLKSGTAAKNGPVYVRVANGTPAKPIGGIEAVAGADVIQIPNAVFMGAADASGNIEISYNL